jgi:hypothetical protein
MSDEVPTNAGPAPAWLGEPLLQPGERVVLWGGPQGRGLGGWIKARVGRLIASGWASLLLIAGIAAPFILAFAGKGLFVLLGSANGVPGYVVGAVLGMGCFIATLDVLNRAGEDNFHVLTDRRFLVIKGYGLVEAFDLDRLRRLVALADAARPPVVQADEHVQEPGKVRPLSARPAEGVAEIDPLLRMLRAAGQLQAPAGK